MLRKLLSLCILWCAFAAATPRADAAPVSVYGAWLCGNDACTWASVRDNVRLPLKLAHDVVAEVALALVVRQVSVAAELPDQHVLRDQVLAAGLRSTWWCSASSTR